VVFLGAGEGAGVRDLGDHRMLPLAGLVDPVLDLLGDLALLGRGDEDGRAVLGADVVALAVQGGGVVHAEEPLLQQVGVGQPARVEQDLHRLGVPGVAVVHVLVARVREVATGVADLV
jgi:hypothetical protein